jgi:hypothetical protein
VALHGGDELVFTFRINSHFSFTTHMIIPAISCQIYGSLCMMMVWPGRDAQLTILNEGITYTFDRGIFGDMIIGVATTPSGEPVALKPGAVITGTSATTLVLPNITSTLHYATEQVTGRARPNKWMSVGISDYTTFDAVSVYLLCGPTGTYTADFNGVLNLVPTHSYGVQVSITNPANGNTLMYGKIVGP